MHVVATSPVDDCVSIGRMIMAEASIGFVGFFWLCFFIFVILRIPRAVRHPAAPPEVWLHRDRTFDCHAALLRCRERGFGPFKVAQQISAAAINNGTDLHVRGVR
jgi:hypothetical protein